MADYTEDKCKDCPYYNQQHLSPVWIIQDRKVVPLSIETHEGSKVLLVFQSPGEEEWKRGFPLQPTRKRGGTTGARINKRWPDHELARENFDLTNAVQCFQGKAESGTGDADLSLTAVLFCYEWFKAELDANRNKYELIITFGIYADAIVAKAKHDLGISIPVEPFNHPRSAITNEVLDALWKKVALLYRDEE